MSGHRQATHIHCHTTSYNLAAALPRACVHRINNSTEWFPFHYNRSSSKRVDSLGGFVPAVSEGDTSPAINNIVLHEATEIALISSLFACKFPTSISVLV